VQKYFVPCPKLGHVMVLVRARAIYEARLRSAIHLQSREYPHLSPKRARNVRDSIAIMDTDMADITYDIEIDAGSGMQPSEPTLQQAVEVQQHHSETL
jgi:hypothetical protein